MVIEEALSNYLLSQSGLTALIGRELHFGGFPEGFTGPGIAVFKISGPRETAVEDPGVVFGRIQFTIQAPTYVQVKNIVVQLNNALTNFTGVMGGVGGVQVDYTEFTNEIDLPNVTTISSAVFYQTAVDWIIAYHE